MTVRIGWSATRPKERKPGKVAGGVYLFELLKIAKGRGTHFVIGLLHYTRRDLENLREKGHRLKVIVVGRLRFANDVTPELAGDVIEDITVMGSLSGPSAVIDRLRMGPDAAR